MDSLPPWFATAASLLLCAASAIAQDCVFVPDNNASTGLPSTIPFGGNQPADPNTANHYLLVRVPRSYFPQRAVTLREIGFAPVSSGTRQLAKVEVGLGTIPSSQALVPTFWQNHPGFGAVPMSGLQWDWRTTAGSWNFLGWRGTFPYDPTTNRDLILTIEVQGGGLPGTADPAFYADPNLEHVYAGGFRGTPPGSGTVGRGAPKMRICFDVATADVYGHGCGGSRGAPQLTFGGSTQRGQTLTMDIRNGPTGSSALMLLASRETSGFLDLGVFGMPGCVLYPRYDRAIVLILPMQNGATSLAIPMPNQPSAAGAVLFWQSFVLDPGANALGLSSTPVGRTLIGN